jgi:glycosyltransferase involved in cell wall biosynthesis
VKIAAVLTGARESRLAGSGTEAVRNGRAQRLAVVPDTDGRPTAADATRRGADEPFADRPVVDVVVPIYNEQHVLAANIERLRSHLDRKFPFAALVTIIDNGSTDGSALVGAHLAARLDGVRFLHVDRKGRGGAVQVAWSHSSADVVAYMDVDLSTGLDALVPMIAPLVSGQSAVAVGSRLAPGARVVRSRHRELISRAYNVLLKVAFGARFSDAQCGFKALTSEAAALLLDEVEDGAWFFDTELLVRAQRRGLAIHEVPVDWVEDPDSRVDLIHTIRDDLRGVIRLLRQRCRTSPLRS